MSLDKGRPGSMLGRISIMGTPWHGLVQGAKLTLPNAVEMDYPQPSVGTYPDQAGATHLVRVPGVPDVVRSGEQAAEDAAGGRQWRNVAMLSGAARMLYGKNLNGWIYTDPNGDRWRVTVSFAEGVLRDFSEPYSFNVTLSRFGVLGGAAASHGHSVTITDWQQATPAASWYTGGEVTSGALHVHAIQPDGSAAAVMICRLRLEESGGVIDPYFRYPVGWAQISISGPGSAATVSISILRSRAQTLTFSNDAEPSPVEHCGGYHKNQSAETVEAFLVPGSSPPAPPAGTTHTQYFPVFVVSATRTRRATAIAAMWPDGNGGWQDVTVEVERIDEWDSPAPEVPAGPTDFTRTVTHTGTFAMRVMAGETVLSEAVTEYSNVGEQTVEFTWASSDGAEEYQQTSTGNVGDYTWSVVGPVVRREPPAIMDGMLAFPVGYPTIEYNIGPAGTYAGTQTLLIGGGRHSIWQSVGEGSTRVRFEVVRYSNNLLGLRLAVLPDDADNYYRYIPPGAPSGPEPDSPQNRPYDTAARPYGSWCPHTSGAAWLATVPVCWV